VRSRCSGFTTNDTNHTNGLGGTPFARKPIASQPQKASSKDAATGRALPILAPSIPFGNSCDSWNSWFCCGAPSVLIARAPIVPLERFESQGANEQDHVRHEEDEAAESRSEQGPRRKRVAQGQDEQIESHQHGKGDHENGQHADQHSKSALWNHDMPQVIFPKPPRFSPSGHFCQCGRLVDGLRASVKIETGARGQSLFFNSAAFAVRSGGLEIERRARRVAGSSPCGD